MQTEIDHAVRRVLIDEDALQQRIAELGEEISSDYRGRDLLLIGVLKGAVFFMADLMRKLTVPCEIDFMAITSYAGATESSGSSDPHDLDINIEGRDVLVVEDIIDSGLTLSYLMRNLEAREPATPRGLRSADQAGRAKSTFRCATPASRSRTSSSSGTASTSASATGTCPTCTTRICS